MSERGGRMGVTAVEEPVYTLAEAEVILRERLRQDMCMTGAGAPGHLVRESVVRNSEGVIVMWNMGCERCGAQFLPSWPTEGQR